MKDNKKKLIRFLSEFKNRPNHLAEYLLKNDIIKKDFLKKLEKTDFNKKIKIPYFSSYNEMNNYYDNLIDQIKNSEENIENSLNSKLKDLILEEEFERAAELRDYMKKNKYKIFKLF